MCFLNLFRVETQGSAGAHKPVSCVTRTRRWPAHMVASFEDPQTNHCFKGHFKRCSARRADGAWKKPCASFYSPPAIIQFDPLALSFVTRENVVQGFVKRSSGFGWLHMWKLKVIFKTVFMSSSISSLLSRLTTYPWSKTLPNCACNLPFHGFL